MLYRCLRVMSASLRDQVGGIRESHPVRLHLPPAPRHPLGPSEGHAPD